MDKRQREMRKTLARAGKALGVKVTGPHHSKGLNGHVRFVIYRGRESRFLMAPCSPRCLEASLTRMKSDLRRLAREMDS